MSLLEVNSDDFEQEVINSTQPVLVDFWGPQCVPCLALMPEVEALAEKYGGKLKMVKVEAPKNRRLCLGLKVLSLPTYLFYKGGTEVDRLSGSVVTLEAIEDSIRKIV
jgi:thioredoxin 1